MREEDRQTDRERDHYYPNYFCIKFIAKLR